MKCVLLRPVCEKLAHLARPPIALLAVPTIAVPIVPPLWEILQLPTLRTYHLSAITAHWFNSIDQEPLQLCS